MGVKGLISLKVGSKYKRAIGQIVEDPVMFWQIIYDTV